MNIRIIAVGKPLSAQLAPVVETYEKRLRPYATVEWQLLPASRDANDAARLDESQRILDKLRPNDTVILLDERGTLQTNTEFAQTFDRLASQHGQLVCIIGGAFGVTDELRRRAQFVWSLSPLVFPHELVRVVLAEQIYRTYMILQGHPYHHV